MSRKCSFAAVALAILSTHFAVAAPTVEERKAVRAISDAINEAGELYKQRKFSATARALKRVQIDLELLLAEADADVVKLMDLPYRRIKTAHTLLDLEGYELPPLPALKPAERPTTPKPDTPTTPKTTGVSFTGQVAPLLVSKCGKCHVQKASGKFSMANYNILMKGHPEQGVVIFPGDADGSRLVEVIEGEEMPPSGRNMSDRELALLKKWIAEGAKFDGRDRDQGLNRIMPGTAPPEDEPMVVVTEPKKDGTVSFARDVAYALAQNCAGCHFQPQQVRGGLNFTNFQGLMRGGDTGPVIKAGDGAGSLLVMKLRGQAGQRMPVGRPPLPPGMIAKIEKWIDEGAKFDGGDANETLARVAAVARAKTSTHEQLSAEREEKAKSDWNFALPEIVQRSAGTKNFLLVGNVGEGELSEYAGIAEATAPKVARMLKAPASKPLVKGRMTLFVFKQRYDYSEFGNMIERRKPPTEWRGHWKYSVTDAYGSFIPPKTVRNEEGEARDEYSIEAIIGQHLAGVYLASVGKSPPRWFAEGTARVVASQLVTQAKTEDTRVGKWDDELSEIIQRMNSADDFLTGNLPPESADIASYSFVKFLKSDTKRFDRLLSGLRRGKGFTETFSQVFGGSPAQLADVWIKRESRKKRK